MTLRVLVAEDHKLVSEGLEMMLSMIDDIDLVDVVDSGQHAIERVRSQEIDVVLMDVNFGQDISGIQATVSIKETNPEMKVLVLSMFTDPGTIAEAIKAGADGYLSKSASHEKVVGAIRDVAAGRAFLDPNVTEGIFGRIGSKDPNALRDRELEVLQKLSDGRSTKEIAEDLYVSKETVKTHLKHIYTKLGVRDRAKAVAEAFRRGLVH